MKFTKQDFNIITLAYDISRTMLYIDDNPRKEVEPITNTPITINKYKDIEIKRITSNTTSYLKIIFKKEIVFEYWHSDFNEDDPSNRIYFNEPKMIAAMSIATKEVEKRNRLVKFIPNNVLNIEKIYSAK